MIMAIIGISGRMGRKIYEFYKDQYEIIGVDLINSSDVKTYKSLKDIPVDIDVIVDFSSPKAIEELKYAIEKQILTLSGTTGYEINEINELVNNSNGMFFWSSNYAKGIPLFMELIDIVNQKYELFDFIEIHASTKKDSPSGTAKMLADRLGISEDKIQSLRLNLAPPIHELIFTSSNERISIRHEIINSTAFIEGFDSKLKELLRK